MLVVLNISCFSSVVWYTSRSFGHDDPQEMGTLNDWITCRRDHRDEVASARRRGNNATVIEEDSPGWDCRIHGNRVCGPDNAQGVTPVKTPTT